jgi:hypothetical protein
MRSCMQARISSLNLPHVEATRSYKALSATSKELRKPLSENRIAWSTGVRITDSEVYIRLLFGGVRDEDPKQRAR